MSNWLLFNPTSGQQDGSVTITASTITEAQDRSGELRFYSNFYDLTGITQIYQYYLYCTAITITNVSWVNDIPASGGTASKDNCSYSVIAYYNNGTTEDITNIATVSGSLEVGADYTTPERHSVGTLTLTASYENEHGETLYSSAYVNAYQQLQPSEIEEIEYYAIWWSTDIIPSGATVYGTANRNNCFITLNAVLKNGVVIDITNYATYSGSVSLPTPFSLTRKGYPNYPLTITATFMGYSVSQTITPYIAAASANDISGITIENVEWIEDVLCTGGTISSANCSFDDISVVFIDNSSESISGNSALTITYSPDWVYFSMIFERHSAGTGTILATFVYDGATFTDSENFIIWQEAYDYYKDWLTIENTGGTTSYGEPQGHVTPANRTIFQYSTDSGRTWSNFPHNSQLAINSGACVKVKGPEDISHYFEMGGLENCIVYGNAMSLIDPAEYRDSKDFSKYTDYPTLEWLFINSHITRAENLILQATGLTGGCYTMMFHDCSELETAPELPATTLARECYSAMFRNCVSLTTPPELPATTLDEWCYDNMFMGCTGLTSVPELPSTSLEFRCYSQMFDGCISLTTPPELPATTLAQTCYYCMFQGCTSLTTAPELPATTLVESCYSHMFSGCTSLTTAPELPATALTDYCYNNMFNGCISLTTAPVLSAETLAAACYTGMFANCTNIDYIKCLATDISASDKWGVNCVQNWVYNVSPTGIFVKNPIMTGWTRGSSGIPNNWTIVDDGQEVATRITLSGLTWDTDIPASGGTATSANCSFSVIAHYENGTSKDVTSSSTVTGSTIVPSSEITSRHSAGTLTLTAIYSGLSSSSGVAIYQEEYVPPEIITLIDYITFTGGSYINTGIKPNLNTKAEMIGVNITSPQTYFPLFGANDTFKVRIEDRTNRLGGYVGNKSTTMTGVTSPINGNITLDKSNLIYGGRIWTINATSMSTNNSEIYVHAVNYGGSASFIGVDMRLSEFKVYNNGTLVADLKAAKNQYNEYGMYDTANDIFRKNIGNGAITGSE